MSKFTKCKDLIVFGPENKLVEGKIGFFDKDSWPVVVADINQYADVVSNPISVANLFAAAPDMYEVLEDIYKNHDAGFYIDTMIRKVLAKAGGDILKELGE